MASYTTVAKALPWLEEPTGLTVSKDRERLLKWLNRCRSHIYYLYDEVQLVMDVEACINVECFCSCEKCDPSFGGITLPAYVDGVEAAWIHDEPAPIYSQWREYKVGLMDHKWSQCQGLVDMGSKYPTQRDIKCGCATQLKAMATSPQDIGKKIMLNGTDVAGNYIRESITLKMGEYVATNQAFGSLATPNGVVIDAGTRGGIILSDADGRILSEYGAGETLPNYKRMKVPGVCCESKMQVRIKANRRYTDLTFDHDIVETDNQLAFENIAWFLKFNASTEAAQKAQASHHAQNARFYLVGQKAREAGRGEQRQLIFNPNPIRKSGLIGRRNCW